MTFSTTLEEPVGLHYIFPQLVCLAAVGWVRIQSGNKGMKSSQELPFLYLYRKCHQDTMQDV